MHGLFLRPLPPPHPTSPAVAVIQRPKHRKLTRNPNAEAGQSLEESLITTNLATLTLSQTSFLRAPVGSAARIPVSVLGSPPPRACKKRLISWAIEALPAAFHAPTLLPRPKQRRARISRTSPPVYRQAWALNLAKGYGLNPAGTSEWDVQYWCCRHPLQRSISIQAS